MTVDDRATTGERALLRLSVIAAICTLVLIFVGGSVTSNDAGLAVPDWPTTFGENMFAYPPSKWVGGVFFEHTHRLTGAAVGVVMIVLAVFTQLREKRAWVRRLAWIMLGGVIVQGVMGGLRVTELSVTLAILHGCFAQLFFCSTVCMVMFMSKDWTTARPDSASVSALWKRVALATSLVIFCQLIAGARYRHLDVGLAYHIIGAVAVTIMVCCVAMWASGEQHEQPLLMRPVKVLGALLVVQWVLGVGTYMATAGKAPDRPALFLEWAIPTLHVPVGAMILAASVALTAGAYRLSRASYLPAGVVPSSGVSRA